MGLKEVIIGALEEFLETLFAPLEKLIEEYANQVVDFIVGTDAPNSVFTRPTNEVWPSLYDYYWESIVPLALALWALSIGIVIFLESTSNLFGGYQTAKLKRRAFAGLLGILSWWWLAALSMQFVNGLTGYIVPDLSTVTVFQTVSAAAIGALGYAISVAVSNTLLVALALVYLARRLALYMFLLMMPVLIAMWIPGLGPFASTAELMKRLGRFYVPFLFMTLPTAILFRLGQVLGGNFGLDVSGLLAWGTALLIPFLALVAPIILFWQAGSVFSTTQRIGRQTSATRARRHAGRQVERGSAAVHGGRNFARGVRGANAVRDDGQTVFGSARSRAHAAASRVNNVRDHFSPTSSSATSERQGDERGRDGPSADSTSRDDSFGVLRARERTPSALPPASSERKPNPERDVE